jgi:hypothetical protein
LQSPFTPLTVHVSAQHFTSLGSHDWPLHVTAQAAPLQVTFLQASLPVQITVELADSSVSSSLHAC